LVHSYWFLDKREKPETANQRPETKSLNKSGKKGCHAKISMYSIFGSCQCFSSRSKEKKRPIKSRMITAQLGRAPAFLFLR